MKKQITQQMKNELESRLKEIQQELDSCEVIPEEKPKYGQWVPAHSDKYYSISSHGDVCLHKWYSDCERWSPSRLSMGNVYKTKEEAEKVVEYQKAYTKVVNRIAELNEGWKPDWNDGNQIKYYIDYHVSDQRIKEDCTWGYKNQNNSLHIKSGALAKRLLKEMEKELKIILEVE